MFIEMKDKSEKNVLEFELPAGVEIDVQGKTVNVKGEKGQLSRTFKAPKIKIEKKDKQVILSSETKKRVQRANMGTMRAHIKNMAKGVSDGITYKMALVYSHFPMTAKVQANTLVIDNFLGEKFPRKATILENVTVDVAGADITVSGINKEDVSQTAANIEQATSIRNLDPRVFQDGIYIVEKDGKKVQ